MASQKIGPVKSLFNRPISLIFCRLSCDKPIGRLKEIQKVETPAQLDFSSLHLLPRIRLFRGREIGAQLGTVLQPACLRTRYAQILAIFA